MLDASLLHNTLNPADGQRNVRRIALPPLQPLAVFLDVLRQGAARGKALTVEEVETDQALDERRRQPLQPMSEIASRVRLGARNAASHEALNVSADLLRLLPRNGARHTPTQVVMIGELHPPLSALLILRLNTQGASGGGQRR
ncbi:MAG: hypothetical protein WD009_14005 [Phycisphaeraceae bacterium]